MSGSARRRVDALLGELDGPAEAIFVDDGSVDCILAAKAKDDPRYRYVGLTRNFGHQIAITAGMDVASGHAVVKEGYDIVYARRLTRASDSRFKRWTAGRFYKVLGRLSSIKIPHDVGDFRLIDRKALEAFRAMPERDRFVRGMFAWLDFARSKSPFIARRA